MNEDANDDVLTDSIEWRGAEAPAEPVIEEGEASEDAAVRLEEEVAEEGPEAPAEHEEPVAEEGQAK